MIIGIPGTLGGAINGNAGAFNESISDCVESVNVLEITDKEVKEKSLSKKECEFEYRSSKFKKNNNIIILEVMLKLKKGDPEVIKNKIKLNIEKRIKKQPKDFSAGSIFKNYYGKISENLIGDDDELKIFNEKEIIPAGILIDRCGLKGKMIGDAKISEEHANFIVNLGEAKSSDVVELINLIKNEVEKKYFVKLKEEIQIL
jgi:UDP-N-acetylmuramate dehydrogenase